MKRNLVLACVGIVVVCILLFGVYVRFASREHQKTIYNGDAGRCSSGEVGVMHYPKSDIAPDGSFTQQLPDVLRIGSGPVICYSMSNTGMFAAAVRADPATTSSLARKKFDIWIADSRLGTKTRISPDCLYASHFHLISPDGRRVAMSCSAEAIQEGGGNVLCVVDIATGRMFVKDDICRRADGMLTIESWTDDGNAVVLNVFDDGKEISIERCVRVSVPETF